MSPMLHWLRSRWRTRGEHALTSRRFLWRVGCAVAVPIAMTLAGLVGLYLFLSGPSRAGARELRMAALADSVSAVASRGQAQRLISLADYVSAGLLSADDLAFLDDAGVSFHAITRSSPDTAVVFRRVRGGTERVYRKDGTRDSYVATRSPDGRFVAVIGPPPSAPGTNRHPAFRGLVVRETAGGRTIGSLVVPGSARTTGAPTAAFSPWRRPRPTPLARATSERSSCSSVRWRSADSSFPPRSHPSGSRSRKTGRCGCRRRRCAFDDGGARASRWRARAMAGSASRAGRDRHRFPSAIASVSACPRRAFGNSSGAGSPTRRLRGTDLRRRESYVDHHGTRSTTRLTDSRPVPGNNYRIPGRWPRYCTNRWNYSGPVRSYRPHSYASGEPCRTRIRSSITTKSCS